MEQVLGEKPWGHRLVKLIADGIRRRRVELELSAQALANRCEELGWPIKRSVLANLESGYRETITVPELFVIAQALEVSPLELVLPIASEPDIEVLPGQRVSTVDALRWLDGRSPLPGGKWDSGQDGSPALASLTVHQQIVERWTSARHYARVVAAGEFEGEAEEHEREAAKAWQELRALRRVMRARGFVPPALPGPLALVDEEPEL